MRASDKILIAYIYLKSMKCIGKCLPEVLFFSAPLKNSYLLLKSTFIISKMSAYMYVLLLQNDIGK